MPPRDKSDQDIQQTRQQLFQIQQALRQAINAEAAARAANRPQRELDQIRTRIETERDAFDEMQRQLSRLNL